MAVPTLSKRGAKALEEATERLAFASFLENQYSDQNENGVINFGVAENTLMQEELKAELNSNLQLQDLDFTYGDHMAGSTRLFKAVSRLMNRYFNPVVPVHADHLISGCGLSAVVDQATQLLCDKDEVILIARPYYSGFDSDVSSRSEALAVGVDTGDIDPASPQTLEAFERAIEDLKAKGQVARAVILCNPHNPLGFNYPRETIIAYCKFCEKHNLHLISDEIYALSQFENMHVKDKVPFTSILSVDVQGEAGCNPARDHMAYGMSKDFCANGLRIGILITQHNPEFRKAFLAIAILIKISSASDALWSRVLLDDAFLDRFVKSNQERLQDTANYCIDWMQAHDVPCNQPTTAHFIWLDLRKYLRDKDDNGNELTTDVERDKDLWMAFMSAGILVAPGMAYHYAVPGHFRFTFCIRRDYLDMGLDRVEKVLSSRRKV